MAQVALLLLVLIPTTNVNALPNGYGLRPGMGWEGDYQDPQAPGPGRGNASYIAAIANFMATKRAFGQHGNATMHELGYWYVNPSSSWDEFNRSESGQLVPNHLLYPDGIERTVSHIHSLGLGYGTYGDWGSKDCDKRPGQAGHEKTDAAYFARIGVDWLKTDVSGSPHSSSSFSLCLSPSYVTRPSSCSINRADGKTSAASHAMASRVAPSRTTRP